MKSGFLGFFALAVLALLCARAGAQNFSIDWYKLSGGGGTSTGGNFSVSGTIGQPDASATLTGGNFSLTGGFWSIIAVFQTAGAPNLLISHAGKNVVVSWPATGSFSLQQNNNLDSTGWTTPGYTVTLADGTNSVTFTPSPGNMYFRLKQ
ncbi:MAG TPA: hypothetical protein VNX46_12150 [Candidatus Acidoferrum sp.]|jgi:hypothetical protein|nr:hypothetical protein [Candidatus Acidoferrum sp.]